MAKDEVGTRRALMSVMFSRIAALSLFLSAFASAQETPPSAGEIFQAIQSDDYARVSSWVNARKVNVSEVLVWSVQGNALGIVRHLAAMASVDVNQPNELGQRALSQALLSSTSSAEMVSLLLKAKADPNKPEPGLGASPLHDLCASQTQVEVKEKVALLLKAGAKPQNRNGHFESAYHVCARIPGDRGAVVLSELLRQSSNREGVDAPDSDHSTPIMNAVRNRNVEVARVLLENGANALANYRINDWTVSAQEVASNCAKTDPRCVAIMGLITGSRGGGLGATGASVGQ